MAGNISIQGETVASRIFRVLDCFDTARTDLTLTEIASLSSLPLSTTKRILAELTSLRALQRKPNGKYSIGIRLWTIGSLAPQQRSLREAALPMMHDLYEATHENVQLAVLDGRDALCIEKISTKRSVPNETHIGGRLPLHATAVGKCLLAFCPQDFLVDIIRHGLSDRTRYTITEAGRLAANLSEVKRTGIALSKEEMTLGVVSVASPIIAAGKLRGSVGVVARSTTHLDSLAPAVRTAALAISRMCDDVPQAGSGG
ncbi:IclR family transcriptional regulator [Rhodococcus sp. UFZ-B548]|uniref:IclR family transcriptional regulator n=1 Tax=Rhodococcus sp. UFZ-B548 TaxID=2742212 RepID=UPI0015F3AEBD|nr:IclR family transcriptional regulator [Rhodococcus sp. UFZ-B548]